MKELAADMMGRDFAFDVETEGLNAHKHKTLGLSLSYEDDDGLIRSEYVVFEHTVPDREDPSIGVVRSFIDRAAAVEVFRPVFEQEDVTMIAHNLSFDLGFLWKMGLDPRGDLYDTMIAEFHINENRSTYGLKQTAARVFGAEMDQYKDLYHYTNYKREDFLSVELSAAAKYAEDDTLYTYKLFEHQLPLLRLEKVEKAFWLLAMPLCRVIAEMQMKGFALDIEKVRQMRSELRETSSKHEHAVWSAGMDMVDEWLAEGRDVPASYLKMVDHLVRDGEQVQTDPHGTVYLRGRPVVKVQPTPRSKPRVPYFNVGSRQQLADLVYGYYGVQPPTTVRLKTNKDGSVGVDKDTLKVIKHFLGERSPKVIDDLLEWRKADKVIGTYLDPFERMADPDDHYAIRANFNQTVAKTGRLSSSNPNLQNVPARGELGAQIRSLFVARPGRKLIVCDYSQLELRLLAHYSGDDHLLDAFTNNLDLHTLTGSRQAGMTYEELAKRVEDGDAEAKLLRTIGKSANFGLSYGMGAKKYQIYLLVNNGMFFELDEVQRQIDGFNQAYPRLYEWKQEIFEKVRKQGYVRTLSGRKRRLPEIWSEDVWEQRTAERQAVNVHAQGGGADIMGMAMVKVQERVRPYGAYILVQVHDELVVEAPEDHAEEVLEVVKSTMVEVNKVLRCPLAVEGHVGDTWFDAK